MRVPPAGELQDRVAARVFDDPDVATDPTDRARVRRAVARALTAEGVLVGPDRWASLVRDLVDELVGLGPLEALLRIPAVTDVMVNGPDEVWVDRGGELVRSEVRFPSDEAIVAVLQRVLGPLGVRLDQAHPWADATLPGGVRLHAVLPPLVPHPTITLRRITAVVPSWAELAADGTVPEPAARVLRGLVHDRRNLVVAGRAGVGKTTLLGRLVGDVTDERVVVIEDVAELELGSGHRVRMVTRSPSPDGIGGVDLATLVRNALRMRPDRLVIGEVRGAEVADLLQAMNTGHEGSMTTVHANGAADALVRLEGMALLAGLPLPAVRAQLASAVDAVVALERDRRGRRRVREIVAVRGGTDGPVVERMWP